jgi:hypothetical protein
MSNLCADCEPRVKRLHAQLSRERIDLTVDNFYSVMADFQSVLCDACKTSSVTEAPHNPETCRDPACHCFPF